MYTVYVIENLRKKRYIGSTANLENRLKMHNDVSKEKARFHRTTYKNGPWKIVFNKNFQTRIDSLKFERFLKTGKGREWLTRNI